MKELTFTYELVDSYFHKKLMKDMKNYFIINPYGIVENLHRRGSNPFNGYPGVYMGAGSWWSTEHNFIFSGMFYYIFVM